jgi:hypothetical protein
MGRDAPGLISRLAPREGDQQCLIRDANEAIERLNVKREITERLELRCECGDTSCLEYIWPSHAEYESVRAYGSRFIVRRNHENPETASVISEHERFAIVEVVAGDARYQALARNTRHAWVDAIFEDDDTSRQSQAPERRPS